MKTNKMLWISALILVLSIPAAFAQPALFENSWFIFAINFFVIWIILFILQAVLMPEKKGQEKAILWIASFGLAFILAWNLGGFSGFIWRVGPLSAIFSLPVIVNTIILSGIGYFSLGLLKIDLKSKQGQIGALLLMIMLAVIISLSLPGFLWETQTLKSFFSYLFVPGEGQGILNTADNKLYVFISSAVLFWWFFVEYFKMGTGKEGAGNRVLPVVTAIIIAAHLASTGTSTDTIIKAGEIMIAMIMGSQLSQNFQNKSTGWLVGTALTFWVSYILFPDQGIAGWLWKNATPSYQYVWWQNGLVFVLYLLIFFLVYRLVGGRAAPPAPRAPAGGTP